MKSNFLSVFENIITEPFLSDTERKRLSGLGRFFAERGKGGGGDISLKVLFAVAFRFDSVAAMCAGKFRKIFQLS